MSKDYVAPWVRTGILFLSTMAILFISYKFFGSIIPTDPIDTLIFQNALLLIVISIALSEKYFTKPADSMVNSLMGLMTIVGVYKISPPAIWWLIFGYLVLVFLFSTLATTIYSFEIEDSTLRKLADFAYKPAVLLGQARVLYSVLFLFAIFTFKGMQSPLTVELVVFWGIFIVIWPLRIPQFISQLHLSTNRQKPLGHVLRTDWPNIVRIVIKSGREWVGDSLKLYQHPNGTQNLVFPLYSEPQGEQMVGTGLVVKELATKIPHLENGFMYEINQDIKIPDQDISDALCGGTLSKLVGFIVEDSTISEIRFEIWNPTVCWEGMLIWCEIGESRIYYQVTNGLTKEEIYTSNRHGFQLGSASQLGILDPAKGFQKFSWVPRMNSPIFAESETFGDDIKMTKKGDFIYGCIPGTKLQVSGPFVQNMGHHTAILGVTGSGKTELAFDLIRHTVKENVKVICIDLTSRYETRLDDLKPKNLSLSSEIVRELNDKLFAVETGEWGGRAEKIPLKGFSEQIHKDVQNSIKDFLLSKDENNRIGIITLEEISNSKATLFITEMYLTCLLNYMKMDTKDKAKVLVVVEEAHTVMPEPSTMGLGDYDSRGLVGKIAQIALQGRKYGVGLLVIAQRTATVSKSILTQCNTVISFNCFDDTSLGFLDNIFGSAYVPLIPNLPPLHALVYGKGLRSQRPLVIQIPFNEEKASLPT